MIKHYNIKVSGKVQGVFFRASTESQARALDIKGFVKNEPDGSVYIEAEAEAEQLQRFVEWCHKGPANAQVVNCDVSEDVVKNFKNFSVQR